MLTFCGWFIFPLLKAEDGPLAHSRAAAGGSLAFQPVQFLLHHFHFQKEGRGFRLPATLLFTETKEIHSTLGLVPVTFILFSPFSVFRHTPWARLLAVLILLLHFLTSAANPTFPLFCLLGSLCSASECSPRFCVTRTVCDFTQLVVVCLFNLLVATRSLQHLLPPPQLHDRALFTPPRLLYELCQLWR